MDEYRKLALEFQQSKGYLIYQKIISLSHSFWIFQANEVELSLRIQQYSDHLGDPTLLRLDRNRRQMEFRELMRQIHNYTVAIKSLVEHTRNIARESLTSSQFKTYELRVKTEFSEDSTTLFLHDLRNYVVHRRFAPLQKLIEFEQSGIRSISFRLPTRELLEWDGWKKKSLEFIAKNPDGIILAELILRYHNKIEAFYKWLEDFLKNSNSQDYLKFWELHDKWDRHCRSMGIPNTEEEFRKM